MLNFLFENISGQKMDVNDLLIFLMVVVLMVITGIYFSQEYLR